MKLNFIFNNTLLLYSILLGTFLIISFTLYNLYRNKIYAESTEDISNNNIAESSTNINNNNSKIEISEDISNNPNVEI